MGESGLTDEMLMMRYRDGDTTAFETLYARHKGALFRYFVRQCRQRAVAEEMFQDVWTNVIRARTRYEPKAKFATWLYRIAHNRLVDHYRAANPGNPVLATASATGEERPADPTLEPERRVHAQRQVARLMALLDSLPSEQREAFVLHEEAGLGIDDIAEAAGVGRETAKSRLRYAVAKLRKGLGESV